MKNLFLSLLLVSLTRLSSPSRGISVETELGLVKGRTGRSRDGREYAAFTKIPFAQPPVGDLRFRNPIPFGKWPGVLDATGQRPACLQSSRSNDSEYTGSEDCLYLSVYVPETKSDCLPVLFYIHGGAFQRSSIMGDGEADFFMDENVILVTTAYRLNLFGFFSLEDEIIPGNFGLKDQALALRWIKENVHSFGGDSNRIVIFGVSAGGASVHHLLLSPLTKDLIRGGVSISGTIAPWSLGRPGEVKNTSLDVVKAVGCSSEHSDDILRCLQSVSLNRLTGQIYRGKSNYGRLQLKPCVEPDAPGSVIPTSPLTTKAVATAPWIASFANGEYLLTYNSHRNLTALEKNSPTNFTVLLKNLIVNKLTFGLHPSTALEDITSRIISEYSGEPQDADINRKLSIIEADCEFVYATIDALHRYTGQKFFLSFERRGERPLKDASNTPEELTLKYDKANESAHGNEFIFLFSSPSKIDNTALGKVDKRVSREYIKFLSNFAHFGHPTAMGKPLDWKPWTRNEVLRVTSTGDFVMGQPEFYEKFDRIYKLWKEILPM